MTIVILHICFRLYSTWEKKGENYFYMHGVLKMSRNLNIACNAFIQIQVVYNSDCRTTRFISTCHNDSVRVVLKRKEILICLVCSILRKQLMLIIQQAGSWNIINSILGSRLQRQILNWPILFEVTFPKSDVSKAVGLNTVNMISIIRTNLCPFTGKYLLINKGGFLGKSRRIFVQCCSVFYLTWTWVVVTSAVHHIFINIVYSSITIHFPSKLGCIIQFITALHPPSSAGMVS